MSIAAFIKSNLEPILQDWERVAAAQKPAARYLDSKGLRDYAAQMLLKVAEDMTTGSVEQEVTSWAHDHAAHRLSSAFSQQQLVAEFRGLRTSVIRRWTNQLREFGTTELAALTRFNEGIDQLLTESLVWYSRMLQETQKRLNKVTIRGPIPYRGLADLSPDAILVHQNDKIVYANAAAARLLGADSTDAVIGRPALDVVDPECHDVVREHTRLVLSGQTIPLVELRWRKLDGTPLPAEVASGPIPWDGGTAVQVIARETTEERVDK